MLGALLVVCAILTSFFVSVLSTKPGVSTLWLKLVRFELTVGLAPISFNHRYYEISEKKPVRTVEEFLMSQSKRLDIASIAPFSHI